MNSVKKVDDPTHRMVTAKGAERIDNHRFPLAPFVWVSARRSWPKPLPVFIRFDKGLDHLSSEVVAVEQIQLIEPEVKSSSVRVSSQEPVVFHQHEHRIKFGRSEGSLFANLAQHRSSGFALVGQPVHEC